MRHVHRFPTLMVVAAAACAWAVSARVSAEEADTATVVFASQPQIELDLEIGDLTQILTPEQLELALGMDLHHLSGVETPLDAQLEQIEVRAVREQHDTSIANIPFGFASFAWAFQNPANAWRILLPVELEG